MENKNEGLSGRERESASVVVFESGFIIIGPFCFISKVGDIALVGIVPHLEKAVDFCLLGL